ncbi:MAG: M28 family peptidase [Pyrinomonadaceae bacterium]
MKLVIDQLIKAGLLVAVLFVSCHAVAGQVAVSGRIDPTSSPKSKYFDANRLLRDVEYLASDELEGRDAERPSIEKARDYLEKRYKESNLEMIGTSYRQWFIIKYRKLTITPAGTNFIGKITGRKYPDKYLIITAHYDHLGIMKVEIYNGASDNASGTAGILAMAEYFKKNRPDHSLLFVAFDAEEQTYQGSKHFMANLPVKKESILLNINLDMISPNDKRELYAAGIFHHPKLKSLLEKAKEKAKVKLLFGHDDRKRDAEETDWTSQSDHFIFFQEKIPFVYFGVEYHKDYHKPTDDFAIIQPEFFVRAVETIIETTKILDKGIRKLKWPYN